VRRLAAEKGFLKVAVFGSVARGDALPDSDLDLLAEAPSGTRKCDLLELSDAIAQIVKRSVDIVTYGGLKPGRDDDILQEAVLI